MKAAIFYGGKDIRIEELPVPEPGPGEVLVRVRSAGICGSDLHPYRGQTPFGPREPHQRGHELAGEVAALGQGVTGLSVGQRVGVEPEHLIGCGRCRYCQRGDTHICPSRGRRHGERLESHGFSEYDVCAASNCHPLPDHVSLDAASQFDCYGCAVHALSRVELMPIDTIAILGTGAVGMTLGQTAKAYGVRRVVMVGTRDEPLDVARAAAAADLGVANSKQDPVKAVMDMTNGEGADVVFETVGGNAPTLNQAIGMARRGGTVSVLGVFTGPQQVDVIAAYSKELRIQWANSYSKWRGVSEYRIALDLLASGRVDPTPFITRHYSLGQIAEAFAAADDKRSSGVIKAVVHP
ncbi:MAG: alcohol dehydrogenase catalytic domain-containing protein [Chloroflexi bacterium]|nr:alcohol dehydrogenase catalytic domain-containing protein [Chloroflexota bacterium]